MHGPRLGIAFSLAVLAGCPLSKPPPANSDAPMIDAKVNVIDANEPDAPVIDADLRPDGRPDARPDANATPDAGPSLQSLVVTASSGGNLYIVNPTDLSFTTMAVSGATSGFDSPVGDTGIIWAFDLTHIWSFDKQTLSTRPGYPVTLTPLTECGGLRAFATANTVYCMHDPQGTSNDELEIWIGSPVQFSNSKLLASPWLIRGSATRVLVSYGNTMNEVAVYDTSLTAIPGSPIDVAEGTAVPTVNDEMGVIAIGTPTKLRAYNRSTLAPIGTGFASFSSAVIDVGYAPPSTIIATLANGSVALVSSSNLSITKAPVSVASGPVYAPVYDATSNRIFVLSADTIYALDATTLAISKTKTFPTNVSGIVARY